MILAKQNSLHPFLVGIHESEDMILTPFQHTLQNSQIRNHTTSVEILKAIENQFVDLRRNLQIAIARVDSTADEL